MVLSPRIFQSMPIQQSTVQPRGSEIRVGGRIIGRGKNISNGANQDGDRIDRGKCPRHPTSKPYRRIEEPVKLVPGISALVVKGVVMPSKKEWMGRHGNEHDAAGP